jgi:PIN domain nuclease of toxin-antitoxin system
MTLLLDTHVFVWVLVDSPRLPRAVRSRIARASDVRVSVVSIWEIAIKLSLGRLELPDRDAASLDTVAGDCGFTDLPITAEHAAGVRTLAFHHTDPFDRLLIAQALAEGATIITADEAFAAYGVSTIAAD